ncbi:hypothetical protein UFOVP599_34 [uncultured Caudovirales phage]|uniref:Uncharacterized protein n=1 Tax=uncultured Caudovirales phage TaxID=2100421 RepID=A0A6J5N0W9_9CAUD|nr:hypothetical protein UFOVP599_34 [uncultured Caudovirales phage]
MAIKWYVKAPVSEYTAQDGTSKKRYQTIGIVTETKKGDLMMKLEMIPLLGLKEGSLWAYLNVPEDKDTAKPAASNLADIESDIPF